MADAKPFAMVIDQAALTQAEMIFSTHALVDLRSALAFAISAYMAKAPAGNPAVIEGNDAEAVKVDLYLVREPVYGGIHIQSWSADGKLGPGKHVLYSHPAGSGVLGEVSAERQRQDAKWGVQNHPDIPAEARRQNLESFFLVCPAELAKARCDFAFRNGDGSYAHIFVEEACEAIEAAADPVKLRAELVQCAAVAVAWIEKIDRDARRVEVANG